MCGINGFNFNDVNLIKRMNESLKHRGPDGSSYYNCDILTLGHTRLSIIDLSELATQPMTYEFNNQKYIIVFNGEIYNYLEIKNRLLKTGKYAFSSTSDTEVLIASYIEWGEKCVHEFNGMWAFAIYNVQNSRLFLSRDRLGVKPLYYFSKNGKFIFSSELKGILEHKNFFEVSQSAISLDSVDLYFSLGYIPAPFTIFSEIAKLEGGWNMNVDLLSGEIISKYKYYIFPVSDPTFSKEELILEGKNLLIDSVKLRMRSDVDVGAFLSGGLDSTSIVSVMSSFTDIEKLHTFSIGFDELKYDETKYINIAKDYFNTNHHHHIFDEVDFAQNIDNYSHFFDEPFADYSALAGLKVSQLASMHSKVVLSGDGGDEVFGGYPIYNVGVVFDKLIQLPYSIRKILSSAINLLSIRSHWIIKLQELIELSLSEKKYFYAKLLESQRYKPMIYQEWTSKNLDEALNFGNNSMPEGLRIFDLIFNTLSNNYLTKVDRTSMSKSIEVRSPFLDYRFVEFSQKIPSYLKVNLNDTKILMKSIISDLIPEEILLRKKMGFTPPIHKWMYRFLTQDRFETCLSYLKNFNPELTTFYKNVYYKADFSSNREYELIKLILFVNWYEYWVNK